MRHRGSFLSPFHSDVSVRDVQYSNYEGDIYVYIHIHTSHTHMYISQEQMGMKESTFIAFLIYQCLIDSWNIWPSNKWSWYDTQNGFSVFYDKL